MEERLRFAVRVLKKTAGYQGNEAKFEALAGNAPTAKAWAVISAQHALAAVAILECEKKANPRGISPNHAGTGVTKPGCVRSERGER